MPLGALYMIQFESHLQKMLGGIFEISENHYFQFKKSSKSKSLWFWFSESFGNQRTFWFSFSKVFKIKEPVSLGVQKFSDLLGS